MFRPFLCVAALFMATPVAAQSSEAQTVMRVMEQMGCVVNEANGETFQTAANLSTAAFEFVMEELMNAGQLRIENDSLVLMAGSCAASVPAGDPAPEAMVATLMAVRDNGCVIMDGEVDGLLGPLGPRAEVMGHLRDLAEANYLEINSTMGGVIAPSNVCDATDGILAGFAAQVPDLLALRPLSRPRYEAHPWTGRVMYVEYLVARGCDVVAREPQGGLPRTSGEIPIADILLPLEEMGIVVTADGMPDHSLAPEYCAMDAPARRAAVAAVPDFEF